MKPEEILNIYKANVVRAMLDATGQPSATLKSANVTRLAPLLRQPQRISEELGRLSEAEKVALARIQEKNNQINGDKLKQTLLQDGVVKATPPGSTVYIDQRPTNWYEGNPDYQGVPAYEDLLAHLARRGLVFSRLPQRSDRNVVEWTPGRVIFVPDFVARHLATAALPNLPAARMAEPPHIVSGSARSFQRDLGRYGRYLRLHGQIPLTTQGLVYKKNLKEIAADLTFAVDLGSGKGEEENSRLYFLRRLLPKVGLAQMRSDGLRPHDQDDKFWQMEPLQRVRHTFNVWRDSGAWNELRQLPSYERGFDRQHDAPAGLAAARKAVLAHIKRLGVDWENTAELINQIRTEDYGFLFSKRKYSSYWYYSAGINNTPYHSSNNPYGISFGGIKNEADGWDKVEAAFIKHLLAGPLFWMGLVDLGYYGSAPRPDLAGVKAPEAYRLTEMGAWLLDLGQKVEIAQEGGAIVVQPNFEILAMEPVSDETLLTLDQFADSKGGDRVITYELSRASVYRGQQRDWPVSRIAAHLETAMKRPLPANVKRTLEEWDALHRRITFRRDVTLVHTLDEAVRRQLEASTAGPKLRPAGPNALLSDRPMAEIAQAIRQAGWPPVQTKANDSSAGNSVQVDAEGRVRYLHRLPNIYTLGALASISVESSPEHDQGAQRRLTAAMVKSALKQNHTVPGILANLKQINQGDIPPELVIKIKAWGNYYGHAHQETVTLIEFRDTRARDELMGDPALKPYLTAFDAGGRPLAVIDADHRDEVNQLLAERGIEISPGVKRNNTRRAA